MTSPGWLRKACPKSVVQARLSSSILTVTGYLAKALRLLSHVGDSVSHASGCQDQHTGQHNGWRRSAFAQGIPGFHIVVGSTPGPPVDFGLEGYNFLPAL